MALYSASFKLVLSKSSLLLLVFYINQVQNQPPLSSILVTSPEPPFVEIPGMKSSYNALIARDTLFLLAERLQIKLNITHPPDFLFGAFRDGRWDGIIGQLLRKEADVGASLNAITYARYTAVDFTVPVMYDVTGILIPFPDETSKVTATIRPYSWQVWIAVLFASFSLCFTMYVEGKMNSSRQTFIGHYMWIAGILLGQANGFTKDRLALRIPVGVWCLNGIIFFYVYTGVLTSIIAVPSYIPVIRSLDQLATSTLLKPVTIKSTAVDDIMLNAKNGSYKAIGDSFRAFPNETLVANTYAGVQRVIGGGYGFLEPKMSLLLLIENDRKENKKCRVTLAKETFYARAFAYTLPKKSPLKDAFNQQILNLQQFGFIDYFQRKIALRGDRCSLKNNQFRTRVVKFSLYHVSSAFILLSTGIILSLLFFCAEHSTKYFSTL